MKNLNKMLKKLDKKDRDKLQTKFEKEIKDMMKLNRFQKYFEKIVDELPELSIMSVRVVRKENYTKIHFESDLRRNYSNEDSLKKDLKVLDSIIVNVNKSELPGGVTYREYSDREYNVYGLIVEVDKEQ